MPQSHDSEVSKNRSFWKDHRAILELLTYTVVLITACVGVCLFILRDNIESHYKAQIASHEAIQAEMQATTTQLQSRIDFLQSENNRIYNENSMYLDLLRNMPATYEYYEAENKRLLSENESLLYSIETFSVGEGSFAPAQLYEKSYTGERAGNAIHDESGIVIAVTTIYTNNSVDLNYSIPGDTSTNENMRKVGHVINIEMNNSIYQLFIDSVDFTSGTYGFTIRQIENPLDE